MSYQGTAVCTKQHGLPGRRFLQRLFVSWGSHLLAQHGSHSVSNMKSSPAVNAHTLKARASDMQSNVCNADHVILENKINLLCTTHQGSSLLDPHAACVLGV